MVPYRSGVPSVEWKCTDTPWIISSSIFSLVPFLINTANSDIYAAVNSRERVLLVRVFIFIWILLTLDLLSMIWMAAVASFSLLLLGVYIFLEINCSLISNSSGLDARYEYPDSLHSAFSISKFNYSGLSTTHATSLFLNNPMVDLIPPINFTH